MIPTGAPNVQPRACDWTLHRPIINFLAIHTCLTVGGYCSHSAKHIYPRDGNALQQTPCCATLWSHVWGPTGAASNLVDNRSTLLSPEFGFQQRRVKQWMELYFHIGWHSKGKREFVGLPRPPPWAADLACLHHLRGE